MIALAIRNVFRHRVRTGMTLAAIAFGVAALILSGGFVHDIYVQLGEALIHSQSGHVQIARAGYFGAGSRSPERYVLEDPLAVKDVVQSLPDVDSVTARVHFSGLLNNGSSDWPIVGEGIQADLETKLGSYLRMTAGRMLNDDDKMGIMVGQGVAQALGIKPGDRATLVANTAEGAVNVLEFEVVGVFQSFSNDFDAHAIRIPIEAAQELLGNTGVNVLVVLLKETNQTPVATATLHQRLHGRNLDIRTWIELNSFYEGTVALYERQFGVLQLIILVMVFLSVANSVNMSVFERAGEFGTMMALGNTPTDILRITLLESILLGLIGATLGSLLGIGLASLISSIGIPMPPPPNSNLGYSANILLIPSVVFSAFAVGLMSAIMAALYPAIRVSRMSIVDGLQMNI